jgi:ABC-type sugar transport system substrate-binding protein
MKMKTTFVALSALALGIAGASGFAVAQQAEATTELTLVQIVQKLESLGYTKIEDVEKDDGVWEAEAISPQGIRVELKLDPKDGRILREERDDD